MRAQFPGAGYAGTQHRPGAHIIPGVSEILFRYRSQVSEPFQDDYILMGPQEPKQHVFRQVGLRESPAQFVQQSVQLEGLYREIVRALAEMGYRGFVSGEFLPRPDADTAAQRALAHLRQVG